ncbi:hypothetical protein M5689_024736 [Euphorbia peplus]|nr:hypothetical protein M5689_024736 [Euphorbia peplus]
MYFFERDLHTKKLNVQNKAKPEGSIAEAYIAYECLNFCSRYLVGIDTIFNQNPRDYKGIDENGCGSDSSIFRKIERPLGKGEIKWLADDWKHKAHLYILNNCGKVLPYAEKFKNSLSTMSARELRKRYDAEFPTWFRDHVLDLNEHSVVPKDILNLAFGP